METQRPAGGHHVRGAPPIVASGRRSIEYLRVGSGAAGRAVRLAARLASCAQCHLAQPATHNRLLGAASGAAPRVARAPRLATGFKAMMRPFHGAAGGSAMPTCGSG